MESPCNATPNAKWRRSSHGEFDPVIFHLCITALTQFIFIWIVVQITQMGVKFM